MKLKTTFTILLLTIVFSCSHNQGNFVISNECDFDINSLYILPDSNKQLINIKKGQIIKYNINMNDVKIDGSYLISFKNSETKKVRSTSFGYYTNGNQVEDIINIKILNDTIITSGKFDFSPN
jgi:hypothetical protein